MDTLLASWLERLLATGVQTALLVAVVWSLCRLLPRLPAASQCWLWWLVALQALLGLFLSPLELPWLPSAAAPSVLAVPAVATGDVAALPVATPTTWLAPSWQTIVVALWLAGVLVMAAATWRDWRRSRALLQASVPCRDVALVQALMLAAEAHGLRDAPELRVSERIGSPQLVGAWRPVLLLPAGTALDANELDMALTHELAHLRRGDLWWGWVPTVARHLFFFHPLLHLAVREYGIAREAACDAAVVGDAGRARHDYGRLLLRLGTAPSPQPGLASASPTFHSLKRRLTMLQNASPVPRAGAIALLSLVALVGVMPLRLVAASADALPTAALATTATATTTATTTTVTDADEVVHGQLHLSGDNPARAYVRFRNGNETAIVNGAIGDLREARRTVANGDEGLWLRQGDARYLISDPALLRRFDALYEPVEQLGRQQRELGDRQGRLGEQQGRLGQEQGELGMRQAELSLETARRAREGAGRRADAKREERAEISARQQELGARQRELGQRQAELGRQQSELGARQAEASRRAEEGVRRLLENALASGAAKRL
ncbi:hypothetical protein FKV24_016445 [Lysobacter maris]|uniref:Peptidase M56 domain-containing protein n=1 Tax=Marilutibacter maris TaxID=1605891 RepID=A0A507ZXD1_9GAMM|nr:M56 family metallopeptidase [Lysobacter maris]KAB8168050.1 hypothetical protein FKV24_016445 [Lysobacter maris]